MDCRHILDPGTYGQARLLGFGKDRVCLTCIEQEKERKKAAARLKYATINDQEKHVCAGSCVYAFADGRLTGRNLPETKKIGVAITHGVLSNDGKTQEIELLLDSPEENK
jgi:hypothetical protein